MPTKKARSFIGIDVSKKMLEVAVHDRENHFHCANLDSAFPTLIAELIARAQPHSPRGMRGVRAV